MKGITKSGDESYVVGIAGGGPRTEAFPVELDTGKADGVQEADDGINRVGALGAVTTERCHAGRVSRNRKVLVGGVVLNINSVTGVVGVLAVIGVDQLDQHAVGIHGVVLGLQGVDDPAVTVLFIGVLRRAAGVYPRLDTGAPSAGRRGGASAGAG